MAAVVAVIQMLVANVVKVATGQEIAPKEEEAGVEEVEEVEVAEADEGGLEDEEIWMMASFCSPSK